MSERELRSDQFRIQLRLELSLGALALHAELDTRSAAAAVVGPSGSGKSTILRVLAGVIAWHSSVRHHDCNH